jgi:hypothetical protein
LIFNDRYLKFAYPSWWTGKLSDVAGLFFFPLFLCAIVCLSVNLGMRRKENIYWINRAGLLTAIAGTALVFLLVKIWPPATWIYVRGLESLGFPSRVTYDPSDLWALLVLPFTYLHGRQFIESR